MTGIPSDSSAELDAFFDAPIGFAIFDHALRYVRVNDTLAAMHGVPADEHRGKTVLELVPQQNPELAERLARVRDTGVPEDAELAAHTARTSTGPMTWRVACRAIRREGRITGVAATLLDVTAQRAAEHALRIADQRLRAAFTATDVGLWHWDPVSDVTLGDRNLMRLFGMDTEKDVSPLGPFLDRVHPDDRARVEASIHHVRTEGGVYDEVYRVVHTDRSVHWLHARGLVVIEGDGRPSTFPGIVVDVTRHFETRERLRESDELRRALLDSVHDGFCIIELIFDATGDRAVDYRFVELNSSFASQAGLVDATGRTARELVPTLDESWYESYGRVALTGESVKLERHEPALGRWFDVHAMRIGDPERRRVAVLFRDVTVPREREAALRRSDAELKRLFETNLLGILFWDLDGHVHGANDEFLRIVGYDRADLDAGAIDWARMTPDEHKAQDERAVDELRRTGAHAPVEKEYLRKDGSRVWVLVGSAATEGTRGVGFVLDISRRKAAEAARRESDRIAQEQADRAESKRAILDAILEAAPAGIILADASGELVRVNPANELLWGRAPQTKSVAEYAAWKGWWADSSPRRGQRLEPEEWAMSRALRGETVRDDIVAIEPFGQPGVRRTMLNSGAPVRDSEGHVTGAVVAQMDISALVAADAALRASNERLEEADRRKDEFIAMLAHELRNPLAPIRTAVEVLRRIGSPELSAIRARDVIDRQITQMARLVDDLLDVSRIARRNLSLRFVACDIADLAWQMAEDHRASFEAAGITLTAEKPTRTIAVMGDPVRLGQVIGNLLSNAERFTEHGGRVAIRTELDPAANVVRVSITDTGVGIDAPLLARLFDPFIQGDQDLARSKGGLGLGLALARGLAELHGGAIVAESEGPGRGARFTLRLPLLEVGEAAAPVFAEAPVAPRPLRLLIVEDNVDAAEMLGMLLGFAGHEVKLAYDADEGLAIARQLVPDVVISDIGLPGALDGYDLARALRADPALAGAYLIALSGYASEGARQRSAEAGFDVHLAKPPDLDKLQRTLADVARDRSRVR